MISQKQALEAFQTEQGQEVDVIYVTSDDKVFYIPADAQGHAAILQDRTIQTFAKDELLRKYAGKELGKLIVMVDYLKQCKILKIEDPTYAAFEKACEREGISEYASARAFEFAKNHIYGSFGYQAMGMTQKIYLLNGNIIEGKLIRLYPYTKLFITKDDNLIMTCPTNFQFMQDDVYNVFEPVMGERPATVPQK